MKNYIYIVVLLISGATIAQEKPKDVKIETIEKTIKYNDGDEVTESRLKVISRETSEVKLASDDKNKLNQERVPTRKKVETMILVDDDSDSDYDFITKETKFSNENKNYKFTPSIEGIDITFDNNSNEFIPVGKAWNSQKPGSYVVKSETYNGIGYFNQEGDFVVEYYNVDTQSLKTMVYEQNKNIQ